MSSATLLASVGTIKNSEHANRLPAWLSPLITLKQSTGIMNLSVACGFACRFREVSLFAAPARQTVVEMARVALALEFAHRSFLVPSGVSTIVLWISACSQTSTPSNLCAMTSMMLSIGFQHALVPKFALVSIAHMWLPARHRSRRQRTNHRSATMCGWCSHPYCGSLASHVGSFSWAVHGVRLDSQDHGRSHVHNNERTPNTLSGLKSDCNWRNCDSLFTPWHSGNLRTSSRLRSIWTVPISSGATYDFVKVNFSLVVTPPGHRNLARALVAWSLGRRPFCSCCPRSSIACARKSRCQHCRTHSL